MKWIKKFEALLYALGALLIVLVLTVPHAVIEAVKTSSGGHALTKEYDWYIVPKESGMQPYPNEQAGFIKDYNAWYVGSDQERTIYLTFDAGYENGYTPAILDALKKHNAPAAFFLVGNYFKRNPELVQRMANEGHLVCNHSLTHKNMAKMTDFDTFKDEIQKNEALCKDIGVEMAKFFRPPEGKFSEQALKFTQDLGYTTVFWSFAYVDWYNDKQPAEEEGIKKIEARTHPGAIVLLHSTSKTNSLILDRVLTNWEKMGYTLKSLNDFKK
jgi:peptidoglycan-N-acetylmuramic acid deacetylase